MATNTWVLTLTTTETVGPSDQTDVIKRPWVVVNDLTALCQGVVSGARRGTVDIQKNGGSATAAAGTLTLSSASGTVGGTIGGKLVTVTWAASDTASATALKTAINADTTANKLVTATSALGVVTITANFTGTPGNGVALVASGTGVTASAATLTGGAAASANSFTN